MAKQPPHTHPNTLQHKKQNNTRTSPIQRTHRQHTPPTRSNNPPNRRKTRKHTTHQTNLPPPKHHHSKPRHHHLALGPLRHHHKLRTHIPPPTPPHTPPTKLHTTLQTPHTRNRNIRQPQQHHTLQTRNRTRPITNNNRRHTHHHIHRKHPQTTKHHLPTPRQPKPQRRPTPLQLERQHTTTIRPMRTKILDHTNKQHPITTKNTNAQTTTHK